MARTGSAEWRGDLREGEGEFTLGSGSLSAPYNFKSRFEEGEGSNPEELIGAAQAACYSMQLSAILAEGGNTPNSVRTDAHVQLRRVEGGSVIQTIAIETTGDVPGITDDQFIAAAEEAKQACLITKALAGVEEITLSAKLASAATAS